MSYYISPTIAPASITNLDSYTGGAKSDSLWAGQGFIFAVDATNYALNVLSSDLTGQLTLLSSTPTGDFYPWAVWGDDRFIYLISWDEVVGNDCAIQSYSVDGDGTLTLADTYRMVGFDWIGGIHGDGNFIYVAADASGLLSFSVDENGILTLLDTNSAHTDAANCVWSDGAFVYVGETGGVRVYSVDGLGNLTYVSTGPVHTRWCQFLTGDGDYLYSAENTAGTFVYSVDGAGDLTEIDTIPIPGIFGSAAVCVRGATLFVVYYDYIECFAISSQGKLTSQDTDSTVSSGGYSITEDGTFIFVGSYDTAIIASFSVTLARDATFTISGDVRLIPRTAFDGSLSIANSLQVGSTLSIVNSLNVQLSSDISLVLTLLQVLEGALSLKMTLDERAKFNGTLKLLNNLFAADSGVTVGGDTTVVTSYVDPGGYVTPTGIYDAGGGALVEPGAIVPINFTIPAGARVTGGFYFARRHGL